MTIKKNDFGGFDYVGDGGTARIAFEDGSVSVYQLTCTGILRWKATFSPDAPAAVVDAVFNEARAEAGAA